MPFPYVYIYLCSFPSFNLIIVPVFVAQITVAVGPVDANVNPWQRALYGDDGGFNPEGFPPHILAQVDIIG